jgi:hypothetical protein
MVPPSLELRILDERPAQARESRCDAVRGMDCRNLTNWSREDCLPRATATKRVRTRAVRRGVRKTGRVSLACLASILACSARNPVKLPVLTPLCRPPEPKDPTHDIGLSPSPSLLLPHSRNPRGPGITIGRSGKDPIAQRIPRRPVCSRSGPRTARRLRGRSKAWEAATACRLSRLGGFTG